MSDYTCITEKASAEDPGRANVIVTPPPMETSPRPCSDVLPRRCGGLNDVTPHLGD